jgi:hypothetical protein
MKFLIKKRPEWKERCMTKKQGAPKGNRNAAKRGEALRIEWFLSKVKRGFLAEWYELNFGVKPSEEQLREAARSIANLALDQALVQEFEKHYPSKASEVF